jgi:23S rRNA (adenine-N6)-dimethyltransferase
MCAAFDARRVAFAQNFLRSPRLAERLVAGAGLSPDDLVVEIGPGRGALTAPLATRCRLVVAIEKDERLAAALPGRLQAANVIVFAADALHFPLPATPYKVVANLPFNVTAAIVGKLTSGSSPPLDSHLVVQREAAARFLGEPVATLPAVLLHPRFAPTVTHRFRPDDFAPPPAVAAVLLRLRRREAPLIAPTDADAFADLATYVFAAWKPTVRDALAAALPRRAVAAVERAAAIDLARPPSAVPVAAWPAIFAAIRAAVGDLPPAVVGARARLERQQAALPKRQRTRR